MSDSVLESLVRTAGVQPSSEWLEACRPSLSSSWPNADAILEQILHHDLRDVVRSTNETLEVSSQQQHQASHAIKLRQALAASQRPPSCPVQTLDESFRLLLQVEEVINVSQNDESRLSSGANNSQNQNRPHSSNQDCYKVFLSDGYYDNGQSYQPPSTNSMPPSQYIVAMTVSFISGISAFTLPGTKVLMAGPLQVRHGVLMCHAGNTTVLGGQVPDLVRLQATARETLQRVKGVGIDPTIRALVWNNTTMLDEQEEDEGESQSRDVEQVPLYPSTNLPSHRQAPLQSSLGEPSPIPPRPPQNQTAPAQRSTAPARPLPNHSSSGPPSRSPVPKPPSTERTCRVGNPYAGGASAAANPYATAPALASAAGTTKSNSIMPTNTTSATIMARTNATTLSAPTSKQTDTGTAPPSTPTTLPHLMDLVQRAKTDPQVLAQHLVGRTFVVTLVMKARLNFNIEKKPKDRKGGDKNEKHEYVMNATFASDKNSTELVTCRVSNEIMAPYFELNASEMRKLNRTDRNKSGQLVLQGGRKLCDVLYEPITYSLRLYSAEVIALEPSGEKPIFYIDSIVSNE